MHSHDRRRALLFPDANFLAHASRLVEIGKVLRGELGFEVSFAGDGPYLRLAREEGFDVSFCFTVPRKATLELAKKAALVNPFWWRRMVLWSIASDVEAIRRHRPHVVVGDMHWSLGAAARECGVPYASVVNASWTNFFAHEIEPLEGHLLTRLLGPRGARTAFPRFKAMALWYWAVPYKIWRLGRGRRGLETRNLFSLVEGDLTLFPDVPELCPTRGAPAAAHYVGPILWNPAMDPPGFLKALDPSRKTIYLSMGSTGQKRFFEIALRAFAGSEYQVIATTGEIEIPRQGLPPNLFVTDFAPGADILARSQLSVNQGGNGTIYQALQAGVPVVGIPTHVDQQIQMQLCERAGVGRSLRAGELGEAALREAVAAVLEDARYRERAAAMREAISRYGGAAEAAGRIAKLAVGEAEARPLQEARWPSS